MSTHTTGTAPSEYGMFDAVVVQGDFFICDVIRGGNSGLSVASASQLSNVLDR
jgi:hypothetical protein